MESLFITINRKKLIGSTIVSEINRSLITVKMLKLRVRKIYNFAFYML